MILRYNTKSIRNRQTELQNLRFLCFKGQNQNRKDNTEWEKMSANNLFYNGFVSRIHKELFLLNSKGHPNLKVGGGPNVPFSKGDVQMVNKQMQRCSISLVIREL
jgi:hypothetical protein